MVDTQVKRKTFLFSGTWSESPVSCHFRAIAEELVRRGHRVVVLDKGRVAASGTIDALKGPAGRLYEVRVKGDQPAFLARLRAAGLECHETEDDVLRVFVPGDASVPGDDQRQLARLARDSHAQVRHLRASLPTLEDVFARAVGEE